MVSRLRSLRTWHHLGCSGEIFFIAGDIYFVRTGGVLVSERTPATWACANLETISPIDEGCRSEDFKSCRGMRCDHLLTISPIDPGCPFRSFAGSLATVRWTGDGVLLVGLLNISPGTITQ
jgi:hypothetical protein